VKAGAFLFDLDGTLIDSETLWARAMVDWIVSRGGTASLETILPIVVGRSWIDIDRELHAEWPCLGETTPQEDALVLRKFYAALAGDPRELCIPESVAFFRKAAAVAPCRTTTSCWRRRRAAYATSSRSCWARANTPRASRARPAI